MLTRLFVLIWLCVCALASAAESPLPALKVEYSASRTIDSDQGSITGRVYVTHDKERTEMNVGGMESITIQRRDLGKSWMLMPMQRMYQEVDSASARRQSGTPEDVAEITAVGNESIEGHATTKYRLRMKDGSAGGFMWITDEGIPMKMDLLSKEGGKVKRITVTLSDVQIGAPDPRLFEVPAGYNKLPGNPFGGRRGS